MGLLQSSHSIIFSYGYSWNTYPAMFLLVNMCRGKQITVSWGQLSTPRLPDSFWALHTSCCHLPGLLQKWQLHSEPEWLGHLNYVQQAWGWQQWSAHCHGSQQLVHLRTNLFCLSAAALCAHSHSLCRHMLFILHPPKQAGKSFQNSQQCHWQLMCWNTQDEKHFFKNISQNAFAMPDVPCLLLTPVHLSLVPFLI